MSDTNQDNWEQLERVNTITQYCCFISNVLQTSPATSQVLVRSTEQVTKLLSETLTDEVTEVTKARPNIGIYRVAM